MMGFMLNSVKGSPQWIICFLPLSINICQNYKTKLKVSATKKSLHYSNKNREGLFNNASATLKSNQLHQHLLLKFIEPN